ncbi:MAG: MBL fold metallo-hydrolase [Paraclostridium sp.]
MKILALEFYRDGYMKEAFAFGGSVEKEKISDKNYGASLQNYLIDTGSEVILVDTGLPVEQTKEMEEKPGQMMYTGKLVNNFIDALNEVGYKVEDIDKVVVTHKHPDHTGELRLFNNAKIYISQIEADAMNLNEDNIVRVDFKNGQYKNFEQSEKIAENIFMIPAYGHTKGNSLVVLENDGLHYMFQGDITYTDEALRQNAVSVVFEDMDLSKKTLNKVREFVEKNDTVYLSTHSPEGVSALSEKRVMKL